VPGSDTAPCASFNLTKNKAVKGVAAYEEFALVLAVGISWPRRVLVGWRGTLNDVVITVGVHIAASASAYCDGDDAWYRGGVALAVWGTDYRRYCMAIPAGGASVRDRGSVAAELAAPFRVPVLPQLPYPTRLPRRGECLRYAVKAGLRKARSPACGLHGRAGGGGWAHLHPP